MRALVTGYGGFSGTRLAHGLADQGWAVAAHCRTPRVNDPRLELVSGDLGQLERIPEGLDLVVHAAATSLAPGVTSDRMVADNVEAMRRLIALAVHHRARAVLFFSSLSVYGDIAAAEVDEATPIVNPGLYGLTKLVGEQLLAEQSSLLPSLSLRLPAVLGGGVARHWLAGLVEKAARGSEIAIFNPESLYNNVVQIDSLVGLADRVGRQGLRGAEIVTVASRDPITVRQAAETVNQAFGGLSAIRVIDKKPTSFTVSSRKAIDRFGFEPLTTRDAVGRYLAEERAFR